MELKKLMRFNNKDVSQANRGPNVNNSKFDLWFITIFGERSQGVYLSLFYKIECFKWILSS